jgi:hypothetical protein
MHAPAFHFARCGLCAAAILISGIAHVSGTANAARAAISEREHELYRELHKMPPAAAFPAPETAACYERLGRIARFTPVPIRVEPAQCARFDMVRLDRITMGDGKFVTVMPAPSLRCSMAEAVADWIRDDVGAIAAELGAPLAAISGYDSYECRPRNNIKGATLSEHGKGNALDVGAIKLVNGATFNLTDPLVAKPFRERMRAAACARFTTVLGPGSDAYHNEHIHLDRAERSHGYRICQWNVFDAAPIAAVPLPRPRPMDLRAQRTKSRQ